MEKVNVMENISVLNFAFLEYNVADANPFFDTTGWNAKIFHQNDFDYEFSEIILEGVVLDFPILLGINVPLYEEHLDSIIADYDVDLIEIDHLENLLLMNSLSILVLSFLVEFDGSAKLFKRLYALIATILAFFSIFSPDIHLTL